MAIKNLLAVCFCLFFLSAANAQKAGSAKAASGSSQTLPSVSPLLPVPQKVSFTNKRFTIDGTWALQPTKDAETTAAVESLLDGLKEWKISLRTNSLAGKVSGPSIKLTVQNGSVEIGQTTDTNRTALQQQAYKIQLSSAGINVTANAPQGLYYGVQSLLQLINFNQGKVSLSEGEITDWPDLNIRMIYWDNAHHLAKKEALKRAILQASRYKINALTIKLEGHFQYKSAPAIVEPYAFSAEEYQELTDFAKAHFVELVPFLDAPAHVSFILKHPEYAHLRLYPNNNYQFSVTNNETKRLLKAMFSELINANKGSNHILLSTDEAYFTGKGGDEVEAAKELGGNGRLLAKFIKEIADTLHQQGRKVLFWGEYPLTAEDVPTLPPYMINGVYTRELATPLKQRGIRQFIYTATQGAEPVFPNYYPKFTKRAIMADGSDRSSGRVGEMLETVTSAINEKKSDFAGVVIAGWADAGLNPETFWLGYATGASTGWNHSGVSANDLAHRFYRSFYGPKAYEIETVYKLLTTQAEVFHRTWKQVNSTFRKPILGNSYGMFDVPQPATDQTLPLLPVPAPNDLALPYLWDTASTARLTLTQQYAVENARLQQLLQKNIQLRTGQQHNLQILLSVAKLCRQNLDLLLNLKKMNDHLKAASNTGSANPKLAVASLDSALALVSVVKTQRDTTFRSLEKLWLKDWFPLVAEANGRKFLFDLDDIKDHHPPRTIDLSYLIYRQLNYPLGNWARDVQKVRNNFAAKNKLPLRHKELQWEKVD